MNVEDFIHVRFDDNEFDHKKSNYFDDFADIQRSKELQKLEEHITQRKHKNLLFMIRKMAQMNMVMQTKREIVISSSSKSQPEPKQG